MFDKQLVAARAMLAALIVARDKIDQMDCPDKDWQQITNAIAQAEAAGITTGEDE
jgi:hypothetical protein